MNIKIDIFNEISWPQFRQLKEVQNLSERDKVKHYNFYLDQLNNARYHHWYSSQPRGFRIGVSGDLLQEDLFFLLQEDGVSTIQITSIIV